jgi:hypothetical protein
LFGGRGKWWKRLFLRRMVQGLVFVVVGSERQERQERIHDL